MDHGLAFHVEDKLRTVLWVWLGEKLTEERDGVEPFTDETSGVVAVKAADPHAWRAVQGVRELSP